MAFNTRREAGTTKSFYHKDNIALYKSQFSSSLIYPDDLNADNFYPDCVCFTIQKRTGVSIDDVTGAVGAGFNEFKKLWSAKDKESIPPGMRKAVEDALTKNAGDKSSQQTEQEVFQTAIASWKKNNAGKAFTPPKNMLEVFAKVAANFATEMQGAQTRALARGNDSTNIIGSIYLNMPNAIQFNEAANWSGDSLGFMGKMARDVVSGGGDGSSQKVLGAIAGSGGNIIGGAIGALPSLVSKLGIGGGMFGAAIGAMAAGGPMQKGAEAALGVAQNPYMEMMFSGVGFRKFQFEFILRPKSSTEVKTVANMLRMFRTFTKPSYVEGKLGKSFMDYPMEFKIEFLTSSGGGGSPKAVNKTSFKVNKNVPQLKNCVCDNVSSNYTPQSIWAAHAGGAPLAVTLGLSFQETELVMAEDVYRDGY